MHEIDFTKNSPAVAYTGETPWHGYGKVMLPDQTLDDWIIAAGLSYNVLERPVGWVSPYVEAVPPEACKYPKHVPIKGRKALIRDDVNTCLSIVSDRYKPIQPKEIMQFFESLVKDEGFKMHTAGALADGKRIWALAETGKEFALRGLDRIAAYLLLTTSYDGSSATTAQFTSIRVVCNNTLSFSLDRGENQTYGIVRVPHSTAFISADVKGQLGLTEGWVQFQNNVIQLADYKVSKRQAVEFFLELLGVTEEDAAAGKQLQSVKKLLSFYESAPGADYMSSKNTTWGLVNAVSYFTDHGRRAQNNGTRFNSAAFGEGAVLKKRAFTKALALAA